MQSIEKAIDRILWGKSIVNVADENGNANIFILKSLSIKELNYINYIYDCEYEKAIEYGIMSYEDLKLLYEVDDIWTKNDEIYKNGLKKKIEILKTQIKNSEFFTIKKKKLKKILKITQKELDDKNAVESQLFSLTAESRAEEVKRRYIVMMSTETKNENRYWKLENEFLQERDNTLIYNLALAYYDNNFFSTKDIRRIARNPVWRFRWAIARKGMDLFGKPISEWSETQNALVYWSQYYDSIFESLERPSDLIINDDDSCDAWMKEQSKKSTPKGDDQKNIFGTKKAKTTKDHQEQFIMVQHGDKEAIEKVQTMNSDSVRKNLREKFDRIKNTKGRIKEWTLTKGEV